MKTKEQLTEEVEALISALAQAELDLKEAEEEHKDEIEEKDKEIRGLNDDIADLEDKIEEQPDTSRLVDLMKHELYVENFHKFSLEQFESFLNTLDFFLTKTETPMKLTNTHLVPTELESTIPREDIHKVLVCKVEEHSIVLGKTDVPEYWKPTMNLRWHCTDKPSTLLQQQYISNTGATEWRNIETVNS